MAIKPGSKRFDWEIELRDTRSLRKYGLKIPQGSLQIGTLSSDDTVYVRNVGKRSGDFDEQRSWKGGRGSENLSENAEAFWDSNNAYTLTPGHVHQTLQWYHARGLRSEDMYMPTRSAGDMKWLPLLDSTLYVANSFAASASYSADKGYLWIRRVGSPASSLTFRLMSDSGGSPNAALKTVTKTITDITDYISLYQVFDWTTTESLTSGTTYWVSIHASAADDNDNHWEVGGNPDTAGGKTSADGSSWSAASGFQLYFRVTDADTARTWFKFEMSEAMYIVDKKDDNTTASLMYINGDRGKATSGSTTTIVDTAKTWVASRWSNSPAWVKVTAGTNRGVTRQITANTGGAGTSGLTFAAMPAACDSTTEYVIYATEWFTQVTFSGGTPTLGTVTAPPVVVNNIAYIPQGTAVFIHAKWNAATPGHLGFAETATGTKGLADMFALTVEQNLPVLWRANNNAATGSGGIYTISKAALTSAGAALAYNTALTWNTALSTGSTNARINNLLVKDKQLYVFKEDGLGTVLADQYGTIDSGVEKTPDPANGKAVIAHGQFFYYSWLHSAIRVYGSTHDDIGDDYRSLGLPDGREGEYADFETYLKLLFCAVDAGTGTSSVLVWDGLGWHEIVRSRQTSDRIRMVKAQVCPATRNRLWTNMGGDLVFQELPYKKSPPRLDSSARYMHEAVLESSAIDMGTASGLPKFINALTLTVKNLNAQGREVYIDYQTDDDVHTTSWTYAGRIAHSPESMQFLGLENIRKFAYRLRLVCNDNSVPIDIEGVVPNGYARTPFKLFWTMQIQAGSVYSRRGKNASAEEMFRWLLDASRQPGRIHMTSVYNMAHNFYVIVHPGTYNPVVPQKGKNKEQGFNTLVVQEI
jgi:hypothetical protein